MGIEMARRCMQDYQQIKNEVSCLKFLRQSLKEAGGKYYIAGLLAYVPRSVFNTLKRERIAEIRLPLFKAPPAIRKLFNQKYLNAHRSINTWEIDRAKLDTIIKTKTDILLMIEF